MKKIWITLIGSGALGVLLTSASAAITVQAHYQMGEAGTLGANNKPLDSSGNGYDLETNISSTTVDTTTPAPGSTAASDFSGGNIGYYGTTYDSLPTNNYGIEVWARIADLNASNSAGYNFAGVNFGWRNGQGFAGAVTNVTWVGGSYMPASTSEWVHLAIVQDAGITTFYVNGVANGGTSASAHTQTNEVHLGVTPGGASFLNGSLDDARIFTFTAGQFDPNTDLLVSEVPEPSSLALFSLGSLALMLRRKK